MPPLFLLHSSRVLFISLRGGAKEGKYQSTKRCLHVSKIACAIGVALISAVDTYRCGQNRNLNTPYIWNNHGNIKPGASSFVSDNTSSLSGGFTMVSAYTVLWRCSTFRWLSLWDFSSSCRLTPFGPCVWVKQHGETRHTIVFDLLQSLIVVTHRIFARDCSNCQQW